MPHTSGIRLTPEKQGGFTLVELLISITLSAVVVTVFIATLLNMVSTATLQKVQLELSQQNQIALDIIERDIRIALAFDTAPAYPTKFIDGYGPANTNEGWTGTWSHVGTDADHRVLILRENTTTSHPLSVSRVPVYIQGFIDNVYAERNAVLNCTVYDTATAPTGSRSYNTILPYYLIYFVRDNTLYRRTLTDTTTPVCGTSQYQKQSCPAIDTSRPITCKVNDEVIAQNVASFTATYYEQDVASAMPVFNTVDAYGSADPTILADVNNVLITLKLQKNIGGTNRNSTLSVRVSRLN